MIPGACLLERLVRGSFSFLIEMNSANRERELRASLTNKRVKTRKLSTGTWPKSPESFDCGELNHIIRVNFLLEGSTGHTFFSRGISSREFSITTSYYIWNAQIYGLSNKNDSLGEILGRLKVPKLKNALIHFHQVPH